MHQLIKSLKSFLEKLDNYRDEALFLFIKPYWPRKITPNHITYIRIIISILLFILLFFLEVRDKILITSLFFVGILTDLLDGSVARGTNRVTEWGAMLDSTSDRLLIIPIAVYSLANSYITLLLALISLEIINSLASLYYKTKAIYLESNIFGKTKMVLQSVVFVAILIVWPNSPPSLFINLLWLSTVFTFLSIFSLVMELKK